MSSWRKANSGLPQKSVVTPLIKIMLMNVCKDYKIIKITVNP